MRCPKCSYLSYDDVERCRNCGYDFALATAPREADAPVLEDPPREPRAWEPQRRRRPSVTDAAQAEDGGPLDLPLFEEPGVPDPPPVAIPPAGPPLSVRRKYDITRPSPPAPRSAPVTPPHTEPAAFEWPDEPVVEESPLTPDIDIPEPVSLPVAVDAVESSSPRLRAGAIDVAVMLAMDVVVFWLTMRVAGVSTDEWRLLPLAPLIGYLFLLDTAYLVTFTAASGQTIGKMLVGLRVVYGEASRVPFGHAVLRSVALLLCLAPLGLGLLPILFDPERRRAHDRLAGTRVVPAA